MDNERVDRIHSVLKSTHADALICGLPANVRLLTGYWPVTGASIAVFTRNRAIALLVPEDEMGFAKQGWAQHIETFVPASLHSLQSLEEVLMDPLRSLRDKLSLKGNLTIGIERTAAFDPASYASTLHWGNTIETLLQSVAPDFTFVDTTGLLDRLKSTLTVSELNTLRLACSIAMTAFNSTFPELQPGMTEYEAAVRLEGGVNRGDIEGERTGGFAWCMSGPNAAKGSAAYQHTTARAFEAGDTVLLHCNSYTGGMWTDITRTYLLAPNRYDGIRQAIRDARDAALAAIRPGIEAHVVDHAARSVLESRGFGTQFRHATGHGVGFAAINHNAHPRIHPLSNDVLMPGMVFNIEPAYYEDGACGIRHCDMVSVTDTGAELLSADE
jgi:Xaa-Pro aminopeptidase